MREALTTIVRLDERELTEQSRGKWPLDDKLIDAWRQIDALFVGAFGLAANPRARSPEEHLFWDLHGY